MVPAPPVLEHQKFCSPNWTKPPPCIPIWKTQPQNICHTPRTPWISRTAWRCSITLPIFTRLVERYAYKFLTRWWLRSTSCSRLTNTINNLSKPWIGWGAGVQRILFWLDQREGNHTTFRCSVQLNKKQLSHLLLRVWNANRQLQGWREPSCLCWS